MKISRLFICTCLLLSLPHTLLCASEESPGLSTLAVPLLSAPINATWAANHGAEWYERGFRGFIFEGMLDDFRPFPAEEEALALERIPFDENNTGYIESRELPDLSRERLLPGNWEGLKREIGGASNRLRAEGISENFFAIKLAPEAPWFSSSQWRLIAESRFEIASRFCRETRLRGICLDSLSDSAFYDYRWDGWSPWLASERLEEEARRFGRRLALIFNKEYPEGVLILRALPPERTGALWFLFLEGLLEGMESAPGGCFQLLLSGLTDCPLPAAYIDQRERVNRLLERRLSNRALQGWHGKGGLVFSLEPIHWQGDMPLARHPVESYVPALYGAAMYSQRYVVMDAPSGGWWQIPPDVAEQFAHLHQRGRASVRFAPPIPRTLDAYQPRLLCEGAQLLGDLLVGSMPCTVLHHEGKTKLLAFEGLPEEMGWPLYTGIMTATELLTGEKHYFTPKEGIVTLPPLDMPLLLEASALEEYALPASLAMTITPPLSSGITRSKMTIALNNTLATPLEGMLTLSTASRYAFGSSAIAVMVNPQSQLAFSRHLQGLSFQGTQPSFTLTFNRPNAQALTRDFTFSVAPREIDCFFTDASLSGLPQAITLEGLLPESSWICCDRRGRLFVYEPESGRLLWEQRFRGNYLLPPVVMKDRRGERRIALANEHNRVRLFDDTGSEKAVLFPDGNNITGMVVVEKSPAEDVLVLLMDHEDLVFYEGGLRFLGRHEGKGLIQSITVDPLLPGKILCVTEEKKAEKKSLFVECLTPAGEGNWRQEISAEKVIKPCIHTDGETGEALVLIADQEGIIHVFSGEDGNVLSSLKLKDSRDPASLMLLGHEETSLVLCYSGSRLRAYGLDERVEAAPIWEVEIPGLTALTAQPDDGGIIAGTAEGTVHAFSSDGEYEWEDLRSTGAITHLQPMPSSALHSYLLFVAGNEGSIRVLEVQEERQ